VRLARFEVHPAPETVSDARCELLDRITPDRNARFRWGYLLGVEEEARPALPAVCALDSLLRGEVVAPVERQTGRRYELSFLTAGSSLGC
jgi:hypothetical protein